jgi:putative hydrolase of the HAD superfamily
MAAAYAAAVTAILLDALGTLLRLDPPAPRLRVALRRLGFEVEAEACERAFAAEIDYYLEHHPEGRDASSLAELRNRCAAVLHDALALPELPLRAARGAMLESIRFEPYPDARPALRELRARGLTLVVASNWDYSLRDVLADAGLASLLDGVVTSAEAGARKPARAPFEAALAVAGCDAADAVHAGDSLVNDVEGARGAGIRAVLVDRDGRGGAPPDVRTIARLGDLAAVI